MAITKEACLKLTTKIQRHTTFGLGQGAGKGAVVALITRLVNNPEIDMEEDIPQALSAMEVAIAEMRRGLGINLVS